jgi:methionyl-tRNA formyltransferase
MKLCIAGKNQIAVNATKHVINEKYISKHELYVCCNKNDDGIDSWQPSLKLYAQKNNIPIYELENIYKFDDLIFISLEYDRIIQPSKFKSKKLFNIHFSFLPAYKGMFTSIYPLLNGDNFSGVTLHKIDDGIDTGDIIDQIKFSLELNETARGLYFKYLKYGQELFQRNIKSIIEDKITSTPQNYLGSSYFSKKELDFNSIEINLNKTSFQIHNQIRAFIFEEYQLPLIAGKKITKSVLTGEKIEKKFFEIRNKEIVLSGIDGYKIILSIL